MTEQEQRITIAKVLWPEVIEASGPFNVPAVRDIKNRVDWIRCPDYPNDLNAMNDACKCLTINQRVMFYGHLYAITQRQFEGESDEDSYSFALVNATASQRAEAFLRSVSKWKD